ncbi:glycosyltransferase family 2 protein [Ligilactobacillus ceti]|uniref:Glycosyltransferase 2-like domain-containing protein n=1 Tax=Ligilactobacillus ceti DSM 22408 TaxID=1122146 RepID=A0A0R2KG71_9LACO|nr:glycosyltransferase family 2 protein [Ligilactobacillus ceti]KRN88392.1 hypothetical protein IV53_GL000356 [Ligilactobacillus ceti DSM 22408]
MLVSIILPVYNGEAYLKGCLNSIFQQTHQDLEIVIIDDGSTDRTAQLIDEYQKQDERIKVVHQKNLGLAEARNVGVAHATAEYLTWIDCDDLIAADYVETMLDNMLRHEADIVMCYAVTFQDQIIIPKIPYFEKVATSREVLYYYTSNQYLAGLDLYNVHSKMFRKEVLLQAPYPTGKLPEDMRTTYKHMYAAQRIVFVNKVLYYYRNTPNSLVNSPEVSRQIVESQREIMEFFQQHQLENPYIIPNYFVRMLERRKALLFIGDYKQLQELKQEFKQVLREKGDVLSVRTRLKYQLIIQLWTVNYYYFYNKQTGFKLNFKRKNQ